MSVWGGRRDCATCRWGRAKVGSGNKGGVGLSLSYWMMRMGGRDEAVRVEVCDCRTAGGVDSE